MRPGDGKPIPDTVLRTQRPLGAVVSVRKNGDGGE